MNEKLLKLFEESEAVLFDMDGVVVDSDSMHDEAKKEAIKFCGVELGNSDWEELRHHTSAQIYQRLFEKYPNIKVTEADFVARKSKIFAEIAPAKMQEVQGSFDFIQRLREKGKKTALVTASRMDTLNIVAQKFNLKEYFDIILSREDVKNTKPDPEAYLKAAKLLYLEPKLCVVVEDSVPGIQSGKAAGCRVVGKITSKSEEILLKAGADLVFENYSELI